MTTRIGSCWLARFGMVTIATLLVATALLTSTPTGVGAAEDDVKILAIQIAGEEDEDDGFEVEPVLIADDGIIVDPPIDEPVIVDAELVVTPELGDPVALGGAHIRKFWCDDDYAGDYGDLAANCVENGPATFTVKGSYSEQTFETGTFDAEFATPDTVSIVEHLPDGYGVPSVFCSISPVLGGEPIAYFQPEPFWISDGDTGNEYASIDVELDAGYYLWCDWFNISIDGGDEGTVIVQKWDCPEGVDPTIEDVTYFQSECVAGLNGVLFHLTPDGEATIDQTTGDAGTAGEAVWTGLPAGPIVLAEEIPAGYGDPIVFCGWGAIYDEDGDGIAIAIDGIVLPSGVIGGVLEHDLYPNEQMYCDWFNIPSDDDGSITINKWTCPAGYDVTDPWADPAADCTLATNGITFELGTDGALIPSATTGDVFDGAVSWDGLTGGDFEVDETIPDGLIAALVTCTWFEDVGPYAYEIFVPTEDGRIQFGKADGDDVVCDWYNVPVEEDNDPDGGELIVVKYWCDGAVYAPGTCALYGGGADFGLQAASGEGNPIFFTTGGDGTYGLSLPAGAYTLDEIGADWCYAESDDVDGDGNVVIWDGHTSVVDVYNCGPGKKTPPVEKFPNTGAGPLAADSAGGPADTMILLAIASIGLLMIVRIATANRFAALATVRATRRS